MTFRIQGLSAQAFRHLYGLPADALAKHGVIRCRADQKPGFPDRISLCDAEPGDSVLLLNYTHHAVNNPFRATHAILVLEGAEDTFDRIGEVPEALCTRTLSLRAFDAQGMMIDADLVEGSELAVLAERLLAQPAVAYLHAHYARRGCYAARIERA